MPDTPRHHHWRNLAELLGAELPPGLEPITHVKSSAEETPARSTPTPPTSEPVARDSGDQRDTSDEAPLAAESEAVPSFTPPPPVPPAPAPPSPVASSASSASTPKVDSTADSPAPKTKPAGPTGTKSKPSSPAPRKSHWGSLARQLGLMPPDEPEEPDVPDEPEVPEELEAAELPEEEPDDFSVVSSPESLASDTTMVNDWHEHAGDIVTDAVDELEIEDSRPTSRRRRPRRDEPEVDVVGEDEEGSLDKEEGDEPRRRRRRRRRRSGRPEPATGRSPDADDTLDEEIRDDDVAEELVAGEFGLDVEEDIEPEEAPRSESRRRRDSRGSRRRPRRSSSERERPAGPSRESREAYTSDISDDTVSDELDADLAEALEGDDVDGEDADDVARPKHTKIPTWDQAIGVLIDSNLASRSRSPHGNGRGRGRGRGPRR
jgi:hypothetical protein